MKLRLFAICAIAVMTLCAPYKQLQPKPVLTPAEQGYIELKNNKKDFVLKKEKKYFILFPSTSEENFYLVISNKSKKSLTSYLSKDLADKKIPGEKIADESETDTQSVFALPKGGAGYYFFMEGITAELPLTINYRYTPQWRFKFENKHKLYNDILAENRVDRKTYESIGQGRHLDGMNHAKEISLVKKHREAIGEVYKQLLAIESIFPASILKSGDEAYLNYKKLKSEIENEIGFQDAYLATLTFFLTEFSSRGNPLELVKAVESFITFFSGKDRIAPAAVAEASEVLKGRLVEIVPFYNQRLKGKNDAGPFEQETYFVKELLRVEELCRLAKIPVSTDYAALAAFVRNFDAAATALAAAQDSLAKISSDVEADKNMPIDDFFKPIVSRTQNARNIVPKPLGEGYGDYSDYNCAEKLDAQIISFTQKIDAELAGFREADVLISSLNVLKAQKDYSTMLGLLKQKSHLAFLTAKYAPLDKMSVEEQGRQISEALGTKNWPVAEQSLRRLHEDANFLNPAEILPVKTAVVNEYEDSLYTMIDRYSRARINKFVEEHYTTVENVDSLYTDSVFLPAYDVTFSSGSRSELVQRKNDLVAHLAKMKENEFPAKAITLLYSEFTKRPNDNGVLKARAIVTHGSYYKGSDKQTKIRIAECDPLSMKWIVKPTDYRRIFALPVTTSLRGKNKYMVRINVDIPTEANFPVYDVNIKLPEEIARNAASEQWYDKITLNRKELKNEGRFTISAPAAANNYECQITPVQMNKGKGNILEITFFHQSFKVHPVSIMVQKPIIKKN